MDAEQSGRAGSAPVAATQRTTGSEPQTSPTEPDAVATRSYHSPQRREQARRTERKIVDAAAALLVERGWSATTLSDIARTAGISSAMLYKVFRTKADLVKRVYDVAVVGDQEPVPFRERPAFQAVLEESDPAAKLAGYAHLIRGLTERVLPVYEQLRAAVAAGDPELRDFAAAVDAERLFGARGIVRDVSSVSPLAPGVEEGRAVDLVWMAMSPEFWALLVRRREWSWDAAETWVSGHLRTTLLPVPDGSQ